MSSVGRSPLPPKILLSFPHKMIFTAFPGKGNIEETWLWDPCQSKWAVVPQKQKADPHPCPHAFVHLGQDPFPSIHTLELPSRLQARAWEAGALGTNDRAGFLGPSDSRSATSWLREMEAWLPLFMQILSHICKWTFYPLGLISTGKSP